MGLGFRVLGFWRGCLSIMGLLAFSKGILKGYVGIMGLSSLKGSIIIRVLSGGVGCSLKASSNGI